MILSQTSSYALRILVFMAIDGQEGYSAKYLHDQLKIPQRYLSRLLTDLSKHGFITSLRGRNGGYVFARKIEKIYLSQIVDAVEGLRSFSGCVLGYTKCNRAQTCDMHDIWANVNESVLRTLTTHTLKDIKDRGKML
jgi:Rrf2 family protein